MEEFQRPNIVILHCDQLRFDGIACNGSTYATTPNIDTIASRGHSFTRHVSVNPVCQPSRGSFFTGLYPHAHGLWCNGPALLRESHEPQPTGWLVQSSSGSTSAPPPTMADHFHAAGYRTAAFGKLHLQPFQAAAEHEYQESFDMWEGNALDDWFGPYYGFEHVELCLGHHERVLVQYGHYGRWLKDRDPALVRSIVENPPADQYQFWPGPIPHALHNTSWLAERVGDYLRGASNDDAPFLAFIGFPGPHHPLSPSHDVMEAFEDSDPGTPADPEGAFLLASEAHAAHTVWPPAANLLGRPDLVRLARVRTAAMIHQIDTAIGSILRTLDELDLTDSTVVAFTSDHGDFLGEHGLLFKHVLTAHSLTHIPFILAGPGVARGVVDNRLMSNVDVLPTLLQLAGAPAPDYYQGATFANDGQMTLQQQRGPDRDGVLVCSYGPLLSGIDRRVDNLSLYTQRYRYTWYPRLGFRELFDHVEDPSETNNLANAADNKSVVESLHAKLSARYMDTSVPGGHRHAFY